MAALKQPRRIEPHESGIGYVLVLDGGGTIFTSRGDEQGLTLAEINDILDQLDTLAAGRN